MSEPEIISPALAALLDIMTSTEIAEAKCIQAAAAIIEYEAPREVYDLTYKYLLGVAQGEHDVGLKLEALKLIRKVEAKRVVPGTARAVDTAGAQALAKRLAFAKRRVALMKDGPLADDWTDDVVVGEGVVVELEGLADKLCEARRAIKLDFTST